MGIETKEALFKLFDRIDSDFEITLPSKHLNGFILLFNHLYEDNIIKASGSKGVYVYLQKHLKPTKGDTFPKREFRKIKYSLVESTEYEDIIASIKPLLDKYSLNGL